MGEHHNAERDHMLQADVIRKLHGYKRAQNNKRGDSLAIGLEQIQVQFQPVLDAFVDGKIGIDEMRKRVHFLLTMWYLVILGTVHVVSSKVRRFNCQLKDDILHLRVSENCPN